MDFLIHRDQRHITHEPRVESADHKPIQGFFFFFFTVWRVGAPNAVLFKGQQYIPLLTSYF